MATALTRHSVPLRPHIKTAKSIDVARLATAGQPGGITVSTLAEAEYFAAHGVADILYAVGITPHKLEQVREAQLDGLVNSKREALDWLDARLTAGDFGEGQRAAERGDASRDPHEKNRERARQSIRDARRRPENSRSDRDAGDDRDGAPQP